MNHYYFSECKANEKASNISIHLYTVPLSNPQEKYSYAHSIAYELRKLNSYITVTAHGQYIASFEEIYIPHNKPTKEELLNLPHGRSNGSKVCRTVLMNRSLKKEARYRPGSASSFRSLAPWRSIRPF